MLKLNNEWNTWNLPPFCWRLQRTLALTYWSHSTTLLVVLNLALHTRQTDHITWAPFHRNTVNPMLTTIINLHLLLDNIKPKLTQLSFIFHHPHFPSKLVTHSFGEYSTVKANIWYNFYEECLKLVLWSTVCLEWSKKFPLIQEIWAFLEPTCVHLLDSRKIFRLFLILTQMKPLRKSEMISKNSRTRCKVTFLGIEWWPIYLWKCI